MKGSGIIKNSKKTINCQINIDKYKSKDYNVSNIEIFTFKDYKKVIKILKKYNKYIEQEENTEDNVSDNDADYVISEKVNNSHDKIFRSILDRKKDACYIINKALNFKITENEIEKYNSSFVTRHLENRESDIVYKLKNDEVYFIIEHQTKIDYTMPLRMLEYKIEVMRSATRGKNINNKNAKVPLVIPIVLYTGHKKWDAKLNLAEIQPEYRGDIKDYIGYNLIDVNNYTDKELLQSEAFIAKAMLIEKTMDVREFIEIVHKINHNIKTEEDKELLENIIRFDYGCKLGDELTEKLIKDLKGDGGMLASAEMVWKEFDGYFIRGRKQGRIEGRIEGKREGKRENMLEVAKTMLEENFSISQIAKITKLTEDEIKNIK